MAEERTPTKEIIRLFLPRDFHASSKYDKDRDLITITPFGARKGNMSIIDAIVTDSDGTEHRYQAMLNRKTGSMKCQRLGDDVTDDDEQEPADSTEAGNGKT